MDFLTLFIYLQFLVKFRIKLWRKFYVVFQDAMRVNRKALLLYEIIYMQSNSGFYDVRSMNIPLLHVFTYVWEFAGKWGIHFGQSASGDSSSLPLS